MSEVMPHFQLLRPATVDEAIAAMQSDETARLCAGGTDLVVNMRKGLVEAQTVIDIAAINDLKRLEETGAGLYIGAGVTLRELAENRHIAGHYRAIAEAAASVAAPSHREVATLGGNLCLDTRCLYYNQSHWWRKANDYCLKYRGDVCHVAPRKKQCRAAFSGDLAPALMVHGAEVEIAGPEGRRTIPLEELYREDGASHLTLGPAEIITAVRLGPSKAVSGYRKVRIRSAIDFPLAGVAAACEKAAPGNLAFKVAVTGTNSAPVLVDTPDGLAPGDDDEAFFTGLGKKVQRTVTPLRTTTIAANYRRVSISALAVRLARELCDRL